MRKLTILATILLFGVSLVSVLSPTWIATSNEITSTMTETFSNTESDTLTVCSFTSQSPSTTITFTMPATLTFWSGNDTCVVIVRSQYPMSPLDIVFEAVIVIVIATLLISVYKAKTAYKRKTGNG